jgi:hypothetical protein
MYISKTKSAQGAERFFPGSLSAASLILKTLSKPLLTPLLFAISLSSHENIYNYPRNDLAQHNSEQLGLVHSSPIIPNLCKQQK